MNIIRQNIRLIINRRQAVMNKEISLSLSRYKCDKSESKPPILSIDHNINDINRKPVPKKAVKERSKIVHFLKKIPFLKVDELRIKHAGYMLYEDFVDLLDYSKFFGDYALADTFYSWFTVTELHIWMLSTRTMAEGEEGVVLRNAIIECLWGDVVERIKTLGVISQAIIRQEVTQLSEQLQAAFIAYDEGLQSDDVVLAGALWRRMYFMEHVDPENLEKLVKYVRKNLVLLDNTSRDNLLHDRHVKWMQ